MQAPSLLQLEDPSSLAAEQLWDVRIEALCSSHRDP